MSFCKYCKFFEQIADRMDAPGICHNPDSTNFTVNGDNDARKCANFERVTSSDEEHLNDEGYVTSPAGHKYSVRALKALVLLLSKLECEGKRCTFRRTKHGRNRCKVILE